MNTDTRNPLVAWFDRHFPAGQPLSGLVVNTALLSLVGITPVLAVYIWLTPGFGSYLVTVQGALPRFLRQILTNGLPVVVAVNIVSLMLFARLRLRAVAPTAALGLDFVTRTLFFAALHAAIFPASALTFGSFGGDPQQALRVVAPTLAGAASFGNLSGVYLFATLVSALPLHMALAETWLRARGYHAASGPTLALFALAIIAAQISALTAAARAAAHLS